MNIQHVYAVYFSPTGNTKRLVCQAASEAARLFQVPCRAISLNLPKDREMVHTFSAGDLVIVGGPTYAGKLPNKILPTYQEKLIGKGALALAVVTYGNRSFDNSLAELCATLDGNGFRTVAAGAFVGTHAFSDVLAPDRPDKDDLALMVRLTDMAVSKIRQTDGMVPRLVVDGDARAPYYVPKGVDGQPAKFLKAKPKTDLEKMRILRPLRPPVSHGLHRPGPAVRRQWHLHQVPALRAQLPAWRQVFRRPCLFIPCQDVRDDLSGPG